MSERKDSTEFLVWVGRNDWRCIDNFGRRWARKFLSVLVMAPRDKTRIKNRTMGASSNGEDATLIKSSYWFKSSSAYKYSHSSMDRTEVSTHHLISKWRKLQTQIPRGSTEQWDTR